jgi:hypothetical protein
MKEKSCDNCVHKDVCMFYNGRIGTEIVWMIKKHSIVETSIALAKLCQHYKNNKKIT